MTENTNNNNTNPQDNLNQDARQFESDLGNDLKKLLMAGVGAVAMASEKSQSFLNDLTQKSAQAVQDSQPIIDDLAAKGADAFKKGMVITSDLRDKITSALKDCSTGKAPDGDLDLEGEDLEAAKYMVSDLNDSSLEVLQQHLNEVVAQRKAAAAAQTPPTDAPEV